MKRPRFLLVALPLLVAGAALLNADDPPKQETKEQDAKPTTPVLAPVALAAAKPSEKTAATADSEKTDKEKSDKEREAADIAEIAAIQKAIDSYVAVFNKADAAALAAHWTESGEIVTPSGATWRGRADLQKNFLSYFESNESPTLELVDTNVKLISPGVAIETGIARVAIQDESPSETEYEAVHVKTAEGWKIDSVRENDLAPPPLSHYENLQPLEWMIGRWVDSDGGSVIVTNARWTTNRNFIVRSFQVHIEDRIDFEGTQIIGWDAHAKTLRSWTFDSDGGFGVGRWTGSGGRWTAQMLFVRADGSRGSSTNIFEVVNDNTVRFRSVGRQVDGEMLPNVDPIEIVRAAD